ncbi:MAG: chromosome segregation protein SMC [Cellvibrionaceae bacterium]|nr:chromosome segregation protein SMC [Cellvibrionaceae bacterium]
MRLKCIKLVGFKSFVDPTTVNFPGNLCAVVGPNGCGKSNIIDAVRWVMGESSAKNLRGEAMTDVIFNGSGGRKPVGQASIELVFDNSDGTVKGEFAGYAEISVKRKVTRDSQNIYFLNGNKCRRRDITDIFLGTGLGPRSYAIIEQGMISKLIEAKPEELRVYVEEAAGISKYKERRRDTENRMRRTQENLERLTDIRDELERQLSRLQRQAQAAEKYSEFKAQERVVKAKLQGLRIRALDAQAKLQHGAIRELELQVEASVTGQVHQDSSIEKYRAEYLELGEKFNEVQGRYYSIGSDIARTEQSIKHVEERDRQMKVDLAQLEKDCTEAREHREIDSGKAQGWKAEILEIEPELEILRESEEGANAVLLEAEDGMHQWQQEWDAFNQKAAEPKQQAEVQQSRIQYLEQVQQRLLERTRKLQAERETLQVGDAEEDIAILEEEVAAAELSSEEKGVELEQLSERIQTLRDKQHELSDQRDALRSDSQSSKGRHASLEALQQAALGASGAFGEWLETEGLQGLPSLAEKISVADGWDRAAEVVLGKSLQSLCIDQHLDAWSERINQFGSGELNVISNLFSGGNAAPGSLAEKVHSDLDLSQHLQRVLIAEDLAEALARRDQISETQSIVTKDGIWLGKHWLRLVRGEDTNAGTIARAEELSLLAAKIEHLEQREALLSEDFANTKQSLTEAEHKRDALRRELEDQNRVANDKRSQLAARKAKVQQVRERRQRAEQDIAEAREQMDQESENLIDARSQLQEAMLKMERDTEQRESLMARREELRGRLEQARQSARSHKDRAHELAMRFQSVKTQLEAITQGLQRLEDQVRRMEERRENLKMALEDNVQPLENDRSQLEALLQKRIAVEQELAEARKSVEGVEVQLKEAERLRQQAESAITNHRAKLETARLEAQKLDVQSQSLRQQLEETDHVLEQVLEQLEESDNEDDLAGELEKFAARISRLGAINLAAIDEYKLESERKTYLDAQDEDLREALETLENAIKKIDRETRTRFKETFDQINTGIQELFPKVFGGGHAYLELTGDDLLDTGIAIMARPPGKKNSTIHLLSGGEKALTAIALVFSIFRLNPAPFCMLDEVDAPLDDANVGRYARMVEQMSEHVQFIYITHNKIAMEMAHQLMGVTMHEPGVSRIVSVDVDKAAELAAI